jgi:hypothetical protein
LGASTAGAGLALVLSERLPEIPPEMELLYLLEGSVEAGRTSSNDGTTFVTVPPGRASSWVAGGSALLIAELAGMLPCCSTTTEPGVSTASRPGFTTIAGRRNGLLKNRGRCTLRIWPLLQPETFTAVSIKSSTERRRNEPGFKSNWCLPRRMVQSPDLNSVQTGFFKYRFAHGAAFKLYQLKLT